MATPIPYNSMNDGMPLLDADIVSFSPLQEYQPSNPTPREKKRKRKEGKERHRKHGPSAGPSGGSPGGPSEARPGTSGELRLACLFYLYDKIVHRNCGKCRFRGFADVKQHLERAHKQALHCPRCDMTFEGDDAPGEWITHSRKQSCPEVDFEPRPGVTKDQQHAILQIPSHGPGKVKKWMTAWGILFPDRTPPESPMLPNDIAYDPRETHLEQCMTDLKDSILRKEQWSTRQPSWNASILASASPEQRRDAFEESVNWFISEEREQARKSKEREAGARLNRTRSSTTHPSAPPPISDAASFRHSGMLPSSSDFNNAGSSFQLYGSAYIPHSSHYNNYSRQDFGQDFAYPHSAQYPQQDSADTTSRNLNSVSSSSYPMQSFGTPAGTNNPRQTQRYSMQGYGFVSAHPGNAMLGQLAPLPEQTFPIFTDQSLFGLQDGEDHDFDDLFNPGFDSPCN